jgi:hypothetical protein
MLFKEILLTDTWIKSILVDDISNEINNKIKEKRRRIDYEYLLENEIENIKNDIASIEYIIDNINNDLISIWKNLNTILKDNDINNIKSFQEYCNIIDNIYKIPSNYYVESNLFNFEYNYITNEELIDINKSLKKIFKEKIKEDVDFYLKMIYTLFTKEISSKLKTLKIRLKHKIDWLKMFQIKNILLEAIKTD